MKVSPNKEVRKIVRALERRGWKVVPGRKHRKMRRDGVTIVIPSTPSQGMLTRWRCQVRRYL